MRYLIVSDIHANWEGLEAVLNDSSGNYDSVVCCGDVVGYGADPNAATDWVREHAAVTVRGNHDKAAVGSPDIEWFNDSARMATLWTMDTLTDVNRTFLKNLPRGPLQTNDFQVFHGSPLDEDDYLVNPHDASRLRGYLEAALSFFGHTHLQGGFMVHRNGIRRINSVEPSSSGYDVICEEDFAMLANPGSVGQPRDGDSRAGYAIYHSGEKRIEYRRVAYDIETAQRKIRSAGLPDMLARRLSLGS